MLFIILVGQSVLKNTQYSRSHKQPKVSDNRIADSCYLKNQKADEQTEIESQGISNLLLLVMQE